MVCANRVVVLARPPGEWHPCLPVYADLNNTATHALGVSALDVHVYSTCNCEGRQLSIVKHTPSQHAQPGRAGPPFPLPPSSALPGPPPRPCLPQLAQVLGHGRLMPPGLARQSLHSAHVSPDGAGVWKAAKCATRPTAAMSHRKCLDPLAAILHRGEHMEQ
mgnify:CR=1 FL=1